MKIIKESFILLFGFIGLMLLFQSCEDEIRGFDFVPTPVKPDAYHFENQDTVVSAASHEYVISMIGENESADWHFRSIEVSQTSADPQSKDWFPPDPEVYVITKNHGSIDWVSFDRIEDGDSPAIKITVKENYGELPRSAKIKIGRIDESYSYFSFVTVYQKPKPDTEPYTMKIRYKGKVYSSQARMNINEDIEYDDPEFIKVMDYLDDLENVETIVMDDEIVDYFDKTDFEVKPELARLRERIERNIEINPMDYTLLTRANDGFQFYKDITSGTIGYFAMFDDTGFKDTSVHANADVIDILAECDNMKKIGLNDKVSSLAVGYFGDVKDMCAVLTVWEDSYFNFGDNDKSKHRISFVADYYTRKLARSSLKNIKCMNSSKSWNDRISSYSFNFGRFASNWNDH